MLAGAVWRADPFVGVVGAGGAGVGQHWGGGGFGWGPGFTGVWLNVGRVFFAKHENSSAHFGMVIFLFAGGRFFLNNVVSVL